MHSEFHQSCLWIFEFNSTIRATAADFCNGGSPSATQPPTLAARPRVQRPAILNEQRTSSNCLSTFEFDSTIRATAPFFPTVVRPSARRDRESNVLRNSRAKDLCTPRDGRRRAPINRTFPSNCVLKRRGTAGAPVPLRLARSFIPPRSLHSSPPPWPPSGPCRSKSIPDDTSWRC